VTSLQTLLTERDFPVDADGLFGPGTALAVQAFQRAHDLDPDGIVGPLTWAMLEGDAPPSEEDTQFPTTLAPSDAGLNAELAVAAGYRELADRAAERYALPVCVIAGVASRERER
jgi:peptidoglycan hydrolase-like protein with peptidoglycan-binding domain